MTIFAANLNSITHFAIEFAVAMRVTFKMAIGALHSTLIFRAFAVYVLKLHRLLPPIRVTFCDRMIVGVEQSAAAIHLPHVAKEPTMTVEIRQLHVLQRRVKVVSRSWIAADLQKLRVRPQSFDVGRLGVGHEIDGFLICAGMLGCRGIERLAVTLVIPPDSTEVAVGNSGARMYVAHDTL